MKHNIRTCWFRGRCFSFFFAPTGLLSGAVVWCYCRSIGSRPQASPCNVLPVPKMHDPKAIEILIDDPWFLVVNKPIDLLTQAIDTLPSLQSRLIEQQTNEANPEPFIGIPHRLDRMTSGTVVVARNRKSLRQLCQQFATRIVGKEYLAWVSGNPPSQGAWEDSMRKVPNEPRAELSSLDQEHSRTATLEYRVLRQRTGPQDQLESLLLIQLGTGRMHQIRLQCGSRGFPILGDRLYGSQKPWIPETGTPNPEYREPPIALHAFRLTFHHPQTAERISATAPPPAEFPWGNEPL